MLLAGQLLPQIDFSIVNVALADMARSLGTTTTHLELVVSLYGVAFAVCLALSGRLGDRYGRRRLFLWGTALFGLTSLACGLAPSIELLLVARLFQGASAALVVPQILATIHVGLRGQAHSRAIALYGGVGGISFVIGQVLGGLLVTLNFGGLGWRNVFLINLPLCALVLATAHRVVPETRAAHQAGIDVPGTLLLATAVAGLLLPLALGPQAGWPVYCLALLAMVPVSVAVLWRVEKQAQHEGRQPLLPPDLLKLPGMRLALMTGLLFFSSWGGFMFVTALALQAGAGLSPVDAGDLFIPLGCAYFVAALATSRAASAMGNVGLLLAGTASALAGLVVFMATWHGIWPRPGLFALLLPTVIMGGGQAWIVGGFFRIGLADVPPAQAGAASAVLATILQASFGLGPALYGLPFGHALASGLDYGQAAQAAFLLELVLLGALLALALVRHRRAATRRSHAA